MGTALSVLYYLGPRHQNDLLVHAPRPRHFRCLQDEYHSCLHDEEGVRVSVHACLNDDECVIVCGHCNKCLVLPRPPTPKLAGVTCAPLVRGRPRALLSPAEYSISSLRCFPPPRPPFPMMPADQVQDEQVSTHIVR